MKSARKIRRLFAESKVTVHPGTDERVFREALTAAEESGEIKSTLRGAKGWRGMMKSRIAKLAVAAAIIIAAVVGGYAGYEALTTKDHVASGVTPLAQRTAETSLIVRGKLLEIEREVPEPAGKHIYWNVQIIRVLHGRAPGQVINVKTWEARDRPSYYRTKEPGMEAILFLNKREGQYRCSFVGFKPNDTEGMTILDAREKEILEAIRGH